MKRQVDWKKQYKADPTDWLLEPDDPGVSYLALRDIVEAERQKVLEARRRAHREGPISQVLSEMNPRGYWVSPGNVYAHKCLGTAWSLMALAQMGGSIEEDHRIGAACSYLLDHALTEGGQFAGNGDASKTFNCFQGNMLTSLRDLGCQDSRLKIAYEWMAHTVTGEGLPDQVTTQGLTGISGNSSRFFPFAYISGPLFACRRLKHCAWAGIKVMTAFARLSAGERTPLIERAIEAGIEYFFHADPATAAFPGETAPAPDSRWWKFDFPVTGMDLLQLAESLTDLGYGADPRLTNTIDLIRSKQDDQGRWLREKNYGYWHKWWVNYGSYDQPNKWVTLRALRVLKRASTSGPK